MSFKLLNNFMHKYIFYTYIISCLFLKSINTNIYKSMKMMLKHKTGSNFFKNGRENV